MSCTKYLVGKFWTWVGVVGVSGLGLYVRLHKIVGHITPHKDVPPCAVKLVLDLAPPGCNVDPSRARGCWLSEDCLICLCSSL